MITDASGPKRREIAAVSSAESYRIDLEPLGRHGACRGDQALVELTRALGVDLISLCGGHGHCGRCRVRIVAGAVSEPTQTEHEQLTSQEIESGLRLACRTWPRGDCVVYVPTESLGSAMRSQVEGREVGAALAPPVRSGVLEVSPPSLEHPLDDASAVLAAAQGAGIEADGFDIEVLRQLSPLLRESRWRCVVHTRGDEVVAVAPPDVSALGLAFDLGTTGIAGYLVDLVAGRVMCARGSTNPQIAVGEDVISRIVHARTSAAARQELRRAALAGLNGLAADLCDATGVATTDIVEVVVVGNTAMHHLLLGLPTDQLALAPFVPAVSDELNVKARDVGLAAAPGAYLYLPPNIAGFVGADHLAVLLATEDEWRGRNAIVLDIGTNTEVSLVTADGAIRSLSCPSGPAFEGYHISDGMRATAGAIERVAIEPNGAYLQTIGGAPPVGLCGSGIVDTLSQLHLAGVLTRNGRIELGSHPRVREAHGSREFVIAGEEETDRSGAIRMTQGDVRETLLAKAAIQTGVAVLLADRGLEPDDVERVIVAGAFGSYMDLANAIAIGMLPELPLERFDQVGNAAGAGAKLALTSAQARADARRLRTRIEYLELASYPGFARLYAQSCLLPTRSRVGA
jgi:uncharacterized 2Fe-2S/4Fe-4S cluster protein (DUF4445 family)